MDTKQPRGNPCGKTPRKDTSKSDQARKSNTTRPHSWPSYMSIPRTSALSSSRPSSNSGFATIMRVSPEYTKDDSGYASSYLCKSHLGQYSLAAGSLANCPSRLSICTVPRFRPVHNRVRFSSRKVEKRNRITQAV